ncbi:hypothetical protein WHR41_08291 [Cladosporium halotolerans]|uniref:Metallo-beta-lactamase domain-containing protein n=1 Tax=Cladosporium halotolerans TaxID=1052096 RepID=A0AB34KGZ5_9PEZI
MCFSLPTTAHGPSISEPPYSCSRLNGSTHLVIQNDKYLEFPYVYVKIYSSLVVVIDTGCGAHNGKDGIPAQELRDFILSDILSPEQRDHDFLVLCTHCHFDHIGGIEAFAASGAMIIASGRDRDFISPEHLSANSLCEAFGTKTPQYTIGHLAQDGEELMHNGRSLGLRVIHTPGHTPDSMAIFDEAERWLFVGDTCYRRRATMPWGEEQDVPVILPLQGNWRDFMDSLEKLENVVAEAEQQHGEREVQLAAGHTTSQGSARDILREVIGVCKRIEAGSVPVIARMRGDAVAPGGTLGDEMFVLWQDGGEAEFSLMAPESFQDDLRET